jgi:hypothetical protein
LLLFQTSRSPLGFFEALNGTYHFRRDALRNNKVGMKWWDWNDVSGYYLGNNNFDELEKNINGGVFSGANDNNTSNRRPSSDMENNLKEMTNVFLQLYCNESDYYDYDFLGFENENSNGNEFLSIGYDNPRSKLSLWNYYLKLHSLQNSNSKRRGNHNNIYVDQNNIPPDGVSVGISNFASTNIPLKILTPLQYQNLLSSINLPSISSSSQSLNISSLHSDLDAVDSRAFVAFSESLKCLF